MATTMPKQTGAPTNGAGTPTGSDNVLDNRYARQGKIETDLYPYLKGRIAATVYESEFEIDDRHPVGVIDANEPWFVDVAWQLTGDVKHMICGKWRVKLFMENIGLSGDDLELENDRGLIDLDPCGDGYYRTRFSIPANKVTVGDGGTPYKAVVGITYLTNCPMRGGGFRPGPIAGFVEFPTIQFFKEGIEP
ncbi:MAG TPA: hypothetical protein VKU38_11165 [Ktedonobacteraceae bacterium]|nr:hypothetical protein [Ktedonobacteraceae bacterium]